MKKTFSGLAVLATTMTGACIPMPDLPSGGGGGGGPAPMRPIYVPQSLSLSQGNNSVSVNRNGGAYPSQVEFCLVNPAGWDKEFNVENYPRRRVAKGSTACTNVNAGSYTFNFWSAGFLGAMQHRGSQVINLTNLEGGRVTVSWSTN